MNRRYKIMEFLVHEFFLLIIDMKKKIDFILTIFFLINLFKKIRKSEYERN